GTTPTLWISDTVGFEVGAVITVTYTFTLTASHNNTVTGYASYGIDGETHGDPAQAEATAKVTISTPSDPPSNPTYYTVTVNYLDQDTGSTIHTAYTTSGRKNTTYDVDDQILETITTEAGVYEYDNQTGADVTGKLTGNMVINVYYTLPEEDIPDEHDVPSGDQPDVPGDVIVDDDTPLGDLPQTGTVAEPAKNVWPLGMLAISLSMAAAGLHITFSRKRKEDEE
ncbi:MAG TPA: hypothetical protein PK597_05245, partial [Oscillospiraceae bacterium]|nr:hypothetical protein [Oscillospiraceae bacterium]